MKKNNRLLIVLLLIVISVLSGHAINLQDQVTDLRYDVDTLHNSVQAESTIRTRAINDLNINIDEIIQQLDFLSWYVDSK